ncbi:MAG: aminotransferase class V-fold PLP-dependent enzyme [Candidatus Peribacteria bacterium]|nr:aminotransferase class V-fold PLP-dependent enzyme [Candidatus Peribacteria bacterium]
MNYKHDFPIFKNNLDLIYFDSTASSQKPKLVIDSIKEYLETNYSNIHR